MNKFTIVFIFIFILIPSLIFAQKFSLSTNLIDYANLGTINLEGNFALAQNWSINASVKYNPFTYKDGEPEAQFQSRRRTFALGSRYWPWHIYSDWWFSGKIQYEEYNSGGIISKRTEEGDRYGLGVSSGYTLLVNKNFNIDFGLGFWGGIKKYSIYACQNCGLTEKEGVKSFIMPNDILVSLVYVF